ncbi:MAG: polymer-forming cytoskeletal protein [Chloroflexi bacterium]|nr:polymer-forming cytoskeletal protein [Chloroflexota bacterium]
MLQHRSAKSHRFPRTYRSLVRRILVRLGGLTAGLLICILGLGVGIVEASDGMRGDDCEIRKNEVIDHDFYFFCNNLTIRGTIRGDLVGVASRVTLTRDGHIMGDILVLGGQLTIQGEVTDDIRFGGAELEITDRAVLPNASSDILAGAISVDIARGAYVPGDVLMLGYQTIINGHVGGNVDFQGQALIIEGVVEGNVDAIVGDPREETSRRTFQILPYSINLRGNGLTIGNEAAIRGHLSYEGTQRANIPRDTVLGTINYKRVRENNNITDAQRPDTFLSIMWTYFVRTMQDSISLILIGILALQLTPVLMVESGRRVRRAFIPAASWGFILFFLSFPLALLLMIFSGLLALLIVVLTLGEITLSIILMVFLVTLNVVLIGGFWFLLVFLGRAITCFVIGYSMVQSVRYYLASREVGPDDPPVFIPPLITRRQRWIAMAIGVLTVSLIANVPISLPLPIELFLQGAVAFAGLGAIFMYGRDVWHMTETKGRGGWIPTISRMTVPPLEDSNDMPLGMDNLPEGFRGFPE